MNILFESGMTFHFRSLLPVMKQLLEKGIRVTVLHRGYFSERKIRNKPRAFSDVTIASLRFVAQEIGLDNSFLDKVHFVPFIKYINFLSDLFYKKHDMFVSTTKGFHWLNRMVKYGKPRIAISYQNFLRTYYTKEKELFPWNCLPNLDFEQKVCRETKIEYQETGLTFLDSYVERFNRTKNQKTNKVLLLHPGGYRNVLTRMGESKYQSYKKQRVFYESILRSVPSNMKLNVKIHPLAARYHDRKAHEEFAKDLGIGIVEGFLGDVLLDYDAILSVGSSALFEVLPFGRPFWVLNYFSRERTRLYSNMSSVLVESEDDLRDKLKRNCKNDFVEQFEKHFYERLIKTASGYATKRVMEIIDHCS